MTKQPNLPGTEEVYKQDLVDAGREYVEIRDERMGLTKQEVPAKEKVHDLMKKYKLETCKMGGLQFDIVKAEETVKVKDLNAKKKNGEDSED